MMTRLPKVHNIKTWQSKINPPVNIMRPSVWGNPYKIGRDGDRKTVVFKYVLYLQQHPGLIERAYKELNGRDLICCCAPLLCHGDVLVRLANPELSAFITDC